MQPSRVTTTDRFGLLFLRLPDGNDLDHYYSALGMAARLLRGERWRRAVSGYYVNCVRQNALRISYFTQESDAALEAAQDFVAESDLEHVVAPDPPAPIEVSANYGGEELRFRRFLVTYAPIALDIMLADLVHARRLVATLRFRITRSRGDPCAHLESTFLRQSDFYRGLGVEDRARFWRDLAHWPNPPQVDWAHMLVNMVLGFDWPPSEFVTPAQALGVDQINERLRTCQGDLTIPPGWRPEPPPRGPRGRHAAS